MEHKHYFKVTEQSVFGLKHVYVVGRCTTMIDGKICKGTSTVMVDLDQLENKGTEKRPRYFLKKDYRLAKLAEEPKKS